VSRILIIEDNRGIVDGLTSNLTREGYRVQAAATGEEGLEAARRWEPHLVILDIMLPRMDGYQVLRALRADGFTGPVLILSAKSEEVEKVRGFRVGADDYVTKPFSLLELIARIDALIRRTHGAGAGRAEWSPEAVLHFGDVTVQPATRDVRRADRPVMLRPKEFDLLLALLSRPGVVCGRDWLLEEVWGYADDVVTRTVDTHIVELRRKLEDDSARPRHILTVRGKGYRLVP
jgi:DNA-binding response OmpR family regulator